MIDAQTDAATTASLVRTGEVSALESVRAALDRIATRDGTLNAFTAVLAERALEKARAIDAVRSSGAAALGPLCGATFAVKNLFDVAGLKTLAGSKINADSPPASADAELISRLEAAGAVLVGALNMGEYAYDFTGENEHAGASRNPHDPTRMSGGSSGGSGSAVAGGLVPLSLASDTNGSIRVPSSLCGVFGLKPTFGRLSRTRTFGFVGSLDHLGPMARSTLDLALAYDAMQGPDPRDPYCSPRAPEPATPELARGIGDLRIALADGYFAKGGAPEAHAAVETVALALGVTRRASLPEAQRARAAAFVITSVEGANLHLARLRERATDFDKDTRRRFLAGAMVPASWYVQAQRFRRWFHARALEIFREVDVLLAPATPVSAPRIGQKTMVLDGVEMLVRPNLGLFTQPISFIGLPVVAVPVQRSEELPIGVQVIAAPWREAVALRVAAHLEAIGCAAARAV